MAVVYYSGDGAPAKALEERDYNAMRLVRWDRRREGLTDEITINSAINAMTYRYEILFGGGSVFTEGSVRHSVYEQARPAICSPVEMWAIINQWRGLWMSPVGYSIFSIAVTPIGDIVSTLCENQKVITKRELIRLLDYHTEWDEWTHAERHMYNWDRPS